GPESIYKASTDTVLLLSTLSPLDRALLSAIAGSCVDSTERPATSSRRMNSRTPSSSRLLAVGAGESERRAFGVAADDPAFACVADLAAERANPLDCYREARYRQIREREAVAGAGTTLVQSEHDPAVLGLPAPPVLGPAPL